MNSQIIAHTSFLGVTGYNEHSQNFFSQLNKLIPTRIRNFSYDSNLQKYPKDYFKMIIEQDWKDAPYKIGTPFVKDKNTTYINLVLNETNHYYFYDKYEYPCIAYNVWETTKQPQEFFDQLLQYDQLWVPTEWQRQCSIEQGYPSDRIFVVPEGVDSLIYYPNSDYNVKNLLYHKYNIPEDSFTFMIFGRWDYRKSITEIITAFNKEFKNDNNVYLILSVDNPFSTDGLNSTEERLKQYKLENDRIKVLHFPEKDEYVQWLQNGDCFLSCSRSEGWNLPLIQAIACGIPTICSDWSGQLEFAKGVSHLVKIEKLVAATKLFNINDPDIGEWAEPDFNHLKQVMRDVFDNHKEYKEKALKQSTIITEKFTWEHAAKKAKENIDTLIKEYYPTNKITKINLGCGNDILPGYINVDRYNNIGKVDLNCDVADLPFKDNTIDEILTKHLIEHIPLNDIFKVISEWKRVLKIGGVLNLHLPDLELEVMRWLDTPDQDKFLRVHKIFGEQNHIGNTHYLGFNCASLTNLLNDFNFNVKKCENVHNGVDHEIHCIAEKQNEYLLKPVNYIGNFVDGPFIEIKGDDFDKSYFQIDFYDQENKSNVHSTTLKINQWTRPHRKYFTNYNIKIRKNGILEVDHKFDCKNKPVLINLTSKSLGDTIAWVPYCEEFRIKHECEMFVTSFWNHLFVGAYPNIKFIPHGISIPNLYASYNVGCFDDDYTKNKNNWRLIPLQKVASDCLGLEFNEIRPKINVKSINQNSWLDVKYVTLSEHSTFQCKYWNRENGWQEIVDYLNSINYKVVVISKEKTNLKNIFDMTNRPIEETINYLYHSEFFMGVSSGPAWLALALGKKVLMISGFSEEYSEFKTDCVRIINKDVCHGCFNKLEIPFDRGDWMWCKYKDTDRQFECTKQISVEMVKDGINKLIKGDI